jgi:hypothetical protein
MRKVIRRAVRRLSRCFIAADAVARNEHVGGWNRIFGLLVFVVGVAVHIDCLAGGLIPAAVPTTQKWSTMYVNDWRVGFGSLITMQYARSDDITIVADPAVQGGKALQIRMDRDEDFSNVANGSPRAEIIFPPEVRFVSGGEYSVKWSTYLPDSFVSDPEQELVITQIHQGSLSGPPPVMLTLRGDKYVFVTRGGEHARTNSQTVCCATSDIGKWVHWSLHYVPDPSGVRALTQLSKDGRPISAASGDANAYADGKPAYLKMGLYKYRWHLDPSNVDTIAMLYGPVSISERPTGE